MSAAAILGLAVSLLGPLPIALGVPPSLPAGLASPQPDSSTVVLTWEHTPGAVRYDVQVDDNASFGSPEVSVSTVSNSHAPTVNLRSGTQYWRVQAYSSTGEPSGFTQSTFLKIAVDVPVLVSPADGTPLAQPNDPPLLRWNSSAGAASYLVEVDDNSDFVGSTTYETKSTSLVVPDPLPAGDWFWRVVATKDNPANFSAPFKSQTSAALSFVISPIAAPIITSPPDSADFELQDVVLDWAPVPGAVSYQVEVATNTDFSDGSRIDRQTGILGTRYSPLVTYDNNQYYWRVRAIDTAGQPTPWSEARYNFNRTWPQRPLAVFPAATGAEDVPAPLYFQWTAVPHASEYELQVGTQANFTAGTFDSCRVAGTTYAPGMFAVNTNGEPSTFRENEDCEPVEGEINYWRVSALDRPFVKPNDIPGVQGLFSETQAFRYMPNRITGMSPSGGQSVAVPTLTWSPTVETDLYEVVVKTSSGTEVDRATTSATSYTVKGNRTLAPGDYTWSLQGISVRGQRSPLYTRSFTLAGSAPSTGAAPLTPLSPASSTTGLTGAPSLTWEPMPGAAFYRVNIGNAATSNQVWFGSTYNNLFNAAVPYPAMTEISRRLQLAGDYDWQVDAYGSNGEPMGTGPEGHFTIEPIEAITGHAVALGGQQLDSNYTGTKNPCTQSTGGCTVPSTPVLKWKADPRVSWYMVYVSEDASFTNLLEPGNAIPGTSNSLYYPALDNDDYTYADNQAGKAYFWFVRPCRGAQNCGPDPIRTTDLAQGTFIKRSPAVTGLTSSDPGGTEITFNWDDYHDTNQANVWAQTNERSNQSAKLYRIEVSVNGTVVETQLVDQATYTAPARLYPEGALTWRVQAVDADDNGLTWSETKTVTKRSPQVTLSSPAPDASVKGTVPFRWQPQAFAASYDIQIARDGDTAFGQGSLLTDRTGVRTAAFTPGIPIPASSAPYVWRVRRTDAFGNKGPWSAPEQFTVSNGTMAAVAPTPGAVVPPNGPVVQWEAVSGATTYRVNLTSTSGPQINATTVATAFAPTTALMMGNYSWSVTALDVTGASLGQVQSSFNVDAQIRAVQPPEIQSPGGAGVGKTLTVRPVSWNMPDVTTTYEWLRDGSVMYGTTGTSYTLTAVDYGKSISVRATGKRAGYLDGVSASAPVATTSGDAVNNITRPTISGTPTVGSFLTGNPGTWSGGYSTTTTMIWLRDGVPIPDATATIYRVTAADADTSLTIRVTATQPGYSNGVMDSAPLLIQSLKAVVPVTISAPNGTGVGATLTLTPPVWNQQSVETTYVWLRDGQVSYLDTSPNYTIGAYDVGKSISVRATGTKSGLPDGTSVSNGLTASRGSAPTVTNPPTIKGDPKVGAVLQVDPGTWNGSTSFTYIWLRNGTPISGATNSLFTVGTIDAASQLSVRVTATAMGRDDGHATTASVSIGKLTSTTSLSVLPYALTKNKRGKLTITVAAPGLPAPTGTLTIKDGKKKLKKLTLVAKKKGVVVFRLPRLKAGKHKLSVLYSGTAAVKASKGKLKLTVGK